ERSTEYMTCQVRAHLILRTKLLPCPRTDARNAARTSWARAKTSTKKQPCSLVQKCTCCIERRIYTSRFFLFIKNIYTMKQTPMPQKTLAAMKSISFDQRG